MRKVLIFIVFCVSVLTVPALKCNLCIGSKSSDCAKGTASSMVSQTCFKPRQFNHKMHSMIRAFAHHDDDSQDNDNENTNAEDNQQEDYNDLAEHRHHKLDVSCVALVIKDDRYASNRTERGCGYIYHQVDICQFAKKKIKNLVHCKSCTTDNCN